MSALRQKLFEPTNQTTTDSNHRPRWLTCSLTAGTILGWISMATLTRVMIDSTGQNRHPENNWPASD